MPKSVDPKKQVLIIVKPAKRGYIVQAAGSDEQYPCLDAEGMGEAIIEILEDPDQASMEFEAPKEEPKAAPKAKKKAEAADDEPQEDERRPPPPDDLEDRPEGWTAGDELLVGLLGGAMDRARRFSRWRK